MASVRGTHRPPSLFLSRIQAAAARNGLKFEMRDGPQGWLAIVADGFRSAQFGAAPLPLWPFNTALSSAIAADKDLTYRLLASAGISVPAYQLLLSSNGISEADVERLCVEPIISTTVVKPNSDLGARGLSFAYDTTALRNAVAYANRGNQNVIIQEYVSGDDFRIYILNGRPLLALIRMPAALIGDGKAKLSELAARQETDIVRHEGFEISLESYIRRHGDRVAHFGERVAIFPATNFAVGGRALMSWTEHQLHDLLPLGATVCKCLGISFCAIDARRNAQGHIIVLEVNSNPAIEMVFKIDASLGAKLIDQLIEEALNSSVGP